MKISLPDVNILLALVVAGHTHHTRALEWFDERENDTVAICRVTQMGFLRLLTNRRVPTANPCSVERAFGIANELLANRRVFFEYELESIWAEMMRHPVAGPSRWTEAYLAAFARRHDYEMVTFDRDFRRWTDLALTVLVQVPKQSRAKSLQMGMRFSLYLAKLD